MKKLFTLLVFSLTLFVGCQQVQPDSAPDEPIADEIGNKSFHPPALVEVDETIEVKEPVLEEVVVLNQSAIFGISVDSIANKTTVSESPVIISGKVSENADFVSINGYLLQNYEKGSGVWNYIAKPEFSNLNVGENVYEIKADGPNETSATVMLLINFEPAE